MKAWLSLMALFGLAVASCSSNPDPSGLATDITFPSASSSPLPVTARLTPSSQPPTTTTTTSTADSTTTTTVPITTSSTVPPPTTTLSTTTTTTLSTTTTASTAPDSTAPDPFTGEGLALLSPRGVPVAIIEATTDGYLVRSPCSNTVEVTGGQVIGPVSVVIDPGHGGAHDTGAVGPNGLVERDLNLTVAEAVEAQLANRGVSAVLTRTGNYPTLLSVRAALADRLQAEVLVSIHHNAPVHQPSDDPGTEIFIQSGSSESGRLGGVLYESIVNALRQFDIAWTSASQAGVLQVLEPGGEDAYGMIRRPATPTALVELGYIANRAEAELFASDRYVSVAAVAIADAVVSYLTTDTTGSGFASEPRIFTPNPAPDATQCTDPGL
ncbi:MAG: N-acetylmuramoyl-L-alanine amidase [Actinomycetia bacterium]|nr:N-acetylmuramoyl-L-alanine amidase [Actinomycetes bacterium]